MTSRRPTAAERPQDSRRPRRSQRLAGATRSRHDDQESATSGLARAVELTAAIVAPTTLLTALLFFFGWSHAYWYCHYFGVNSTVLGFTTADYLIRSPDGLFVPLTVGAVGVLLAIAAHRRLAASDPGSRRTRTLARCGTVVGGVLTALGIANALGLKILNYPPLPALSLAVGAPVLLYSTRLLRRFRDSKGQGDRDRPGVQVAEWAGVFILVGLALFWAVVDYSAAVGTNRARATVSQLPTQPSVVLYSARSLGIQGPGVRELQCSDPESTYRVRYTGLKLVLQSGNQYFMLPSGWTPGNGTALVLPRSDTLRLEFLPAASPNREVGATCE